MTTTNMIGYGIPLVDVGCCCDRCCGREDCNTSFRDMADGYLARHQDLRNGVIFLDLRLGSEAAHDKIFKWNDIYLNNRAKTIQRCFRSFQEMNERNCLNVGYGIPIFPTLDEDELTPYLNLDEGYIRPNTEMWYELTGDFPREESNSDDSDEDGYWNDDWNIYDDWTFKDLIRFLKLNDIYLTNLAKKIQRWFRSFEELPMACPCPESVQRE